VLLWPSLVKVRPWNWCPHDFRFSDLPEKITKDGNIRHIVVDGKTSKRLLDVLL
jgi:hypothetical protein